MSKLYRTYLFKDKDPVIDIARTCVQIFATTNNISFSRALTLLEKASGVSRKTMENWFGGPRSAPVSVVSLRSCARRARKSRSARPKWVAFVT